LTDGLFDLAVLVVLCGCSLALGFVVGFVQGERHEREKR
jgi:hypothetical protein